MSSTASLRPQIEPIPLAEALVELPLSAPIPGGDRLVSGVSVDSNDLEAGWIFVAVGGETFHGIKFAPAAAERGAVAILTDERGVREAAEFKLEVPVIEVPDPRLAAALVAHRIYASTFADLVLVGVTGTNGKTTTTYLVRGALTPKYQRVALMGTLEVAVSDTPIVSSRTTHEAPVVYRALAVAAQNGYRAAVVEASSHALSLHRIAGLEFDSVLFTNLQHDHLDFYGTMDYYFAAKAQLFERTRARRGVVAVDDQWGQLLAHRAQIPVDTVSALSPTPPDLIGDQHHWAVTSLHNDPERWGISFQLRDPAGQQHDCFCPIPGKVNVQNAALALVAATQLGVTLDEARAGLAETAPPPGRMELVTTIDRQPRVLVDYAHTPEAMSALLETLRPLVAGELIVVFGTDGDRDASKREELAAIAARGADRLWVTDENPRTEDPQQVRDYLIRGIRSVRPDLDRVLEVKTSRRDAIRRAILAGRPGDLVVITGKGAEPYQEIDGVKHAHLDSAVAWEVTRETNLF